MTTQPTTRRAADKLREVARYMLNNADALVGDLDSVYIIEGGLRFSFELCDDQSIPTITVTRECIVYERGE